MERKRKIVKVHYCFYDDPFVALCGIPTRNTNTSNKREEVTCGNCIKKLIVKRKKI